jgi:hypothetical protein
VAFKVYVDTGEDEVHTNALTFDSVGAAEVYARDLCSRWLLTRGWYVLEDRDQGAHVPKVWAAEHCTAYGP